jgi:hypothetical protein
LTTSALQPPVRIPVLDISDVIRARSKHQFSHIKSDVTTASLYPTDTGGTGSSVDKKIGAQLQDRLATDDAGHIIGNQLGGSGQVLNNLFPQERNHNQGHASTYQLWRKYEDEVREALTPRKSSSVGRTGRCNCDNNFMGEMTVKLWYENSFRNGAPRPYSLRPIEVTSFTVIRQPISLAVSFGSIAILLDS